MLYWANSRRTVMAKCGYNSIFFGNWTYLVLSDHGRIIAHISEEEILDIIKALPNKGMGPASIPLRLLKIVADIIVIPLCLIINTSFTTGIFPNVLKTTKIIPLHKGGSNDELNNVRPFSLLSIFDKLLRN